MRAVIQRVNRASVKVDGDVIGEIGLGLCLLIGITHDDSDDDLKYIVAKTLNMRIFPPDSPPSAMHKKIKEITTSDIKIIPPLMLVLFPRAPSFSRPSARSSRPRSALALRPGDVGLRQ